MIEFEVARSQVTRGQWKFLMSRVPIVLLSGGFGAGKTLALGLKLLQLKSLNPNVPGLLLAQTWRSMWSVTLRRLFGFLRQSIPKNRMPKVVDRQGECYLDFGDGVPIFLRSAHDESSFDGLDVGWACGDEVRHWTQKAHEVLLGRVRIPCALSQIAYASTPSMGWMADEFNTGRLDRQLIISPTRENAKNLTAGFIENLRLSYSKRLWKAVVEGRFTILEGAVYESFDADASSPWFIEFEYSDHRPTILMVDPGFRRSAWVFAQELTPTSWCIFDELMPDTTSDDSCVQMVNDKGLPIDEIWCDPASDATQSAFNIDTIDMMHGIKCRGLSPIRYIAQPFNRVPYGVDKLRTLLGDPEAGQPIRLKFDKKLLAKERSMPRGVVKSLASYQYPEAKDGRQVTDHPLKDGRNDHACDAVRQFAVGKWLTSPLREVDKKLKALKTRGYKIVNDRAA